MVLLSASSASLDLLETQVTPRVYLCVGHGTFQQDVQKAGSQHVEKAERPFVVIWEEPWIIV